MKYDAIYKNIGRNIKKYREQCCLTQQQLADALGMSLNHIGKIEVGFDRPSLYALIDIAEVLTVPLKNLFEEN